MERFISRDVMKLGSKISYEDMMDEWMIREGESWLEYAKGRGYDSVREWRESYLKSFGLMECDSWYNAEVYDNVEFLEHLYMGPYKGWMKYYGGNRDESRFIDCLDTVTDYEDYKATIRNNSKVQGFVDDFVPETTFIVGYDGERYCLIDGHHRASALAIKYLDGEDISDIEIKLKLLDLRGEQEVFDSFFYYDPS